MVAAQRPLLTRCPHTKMEPALDKGLFLQIVKCIGLRVRNQDVTSAQSILGSKSLLNIKRVRNIRPDGDGFRVLLLNPIIGPQLPEQYKNALKDVPFEIKQEQVEIKYEQLDADEVLRKLLPDDIEVPSGFETVGHIAHLNLRPEHEPYKHRIGQVIIDKAANISTVVNKTGIIETQFRTFPMEILAGDANTQVDMRVNGLRFKFDFAKVYWNSRLSDEHERLVIQRFSRGDLIVDAFCGVGPFAVRAAKKQCAVIANDLNPESVRSLAENVRINKIQLDDFSHSDVSGISKKKLPEAGRVQAYNGDARDFIRFAFRDYNGESSRRTHLVMNLPATAIEFLDALQGAFPALPQANPLPFVHCYCFSSGATLEDRKADVEKRVRMALGFEAVDVEVRDVRDVAPNKYMLCAHFEVPRQVAFAKKLVGNEEDNAKKVKTDSIS